MIYPFLRLLDYFPKSSNLITLGLVASGNPHLDSLPVSSSLSQASPAWLLCVPSCLIPLQCPTAPIYPGCLTFSLIPILLTSL